MADVYVYDLLESLSLSDDDFVLVNIGTGLKRIKFSVLRQLASSGLPQSDIDKINAIDIRSDGSKFLDNSGNYRLLSKDDIKDLDVTLPVASQDTLGGVKIDNDTIKINDGIISADVIGNWSTGIYYPVGYFVIYEDKLYQCINANSDNTWIESNWSLVGASGDKGEKGDKGEDGFSPVATVEQTDTGCIVSITDLNGTTTANVLNGISGTNGANGEDGFSPVANIVETETGATISITDSTGTTTVNINNGTNGTDGIDGVTPHIDETTKHWFIGDIDTGITAEGKLKITSDSVTMYATFPASGWSDTAPYTQTVYVSSITDDMSPIIDISFSEDTALWKTESEAYGCLTKVETGEGNIIGYCINNKPTSDFTIKIKIFGYQSTTSTSSDIEALFT